MGYVIIIMTGRVLNRDEELQHGTINYDCETETAGKTDNFAYTRHLDRGKKKRKKKNNTEKN